MTCAHGSNPSAYCQNAIGPNCIEGLWFLDLFFTIFFLVGSAMPTAMVFGALKAKRLADALRSRGVQKQGLCIGKRTYITRGKNSSTTHYKVMISYPADPNGMETCQMEFNTTGATFSTAQERVTCMQVVHLPEAPLSASLASDLNSSGGGAGNCFAFLFVGFFFSMWNGMLLSVAPWCYSPCWAYPIGIYLGCKGGVGFGGVGQAGEGGTKIPTSEVAMQQVQPSVFQAHAGAYDQSSSPFLGQNNVIQAGVINAVPVTTPAGSGGIADEIAKLSDLHDRGVLNYSEFQAAKQRALNGP